MGVNALDCAAINRASANTRGTYSLTFTNPKTKQPETQTGSYVTSFKKEADGSWKAEDDIVTPGSPSSPAD